MPFHFCQDEFLMLMAFMGSLPFIGIYWRRFASWLKARKKPHCCDHSHPH